jgi:hypothetical protein
VAAGLQWEGLTVYESAIGLGRLGAVHNASIGVSHCIPKVQREYLRCFRRVISRTASIYRVRSCAEDSRLLESSFANDVVGVGVFR